MTTGDFLAAMATLSAQRAAAAQARESTNELLARLADLPAPPPLRLSTQGFDLIAELKLRSPALGQLRDAAADDIEDRIRRYAAGGAAAISVLTEPSRFDGSLQHLERAVRALAAYPVPAMRKDFLVDPYQLLEARAAGAGGVLLIVRMLTPAMLARLLDTALEQQLFVLLEVFDERDIDAAVGLLEPRWSRLDGESSDRASSERVLLGVNCRDLVTLQVVPQRLETLVGTLPSWLPRVAESGLLSPADAARLAAAGYDMALVGSALMIGGQPRELAVAMLQAGREALGGVARRTRDGGAAARMAD